jgi:hypothetical protein
MREGKLVLEKVLEVIWLFLAMRVTSCSCVKGSLKLNGGSVSSVRFEIFIREVAGNSVTISITFILKNEPMGICET